MESAEAVPRRNPSLDLTSCDREPIQIPGAIQPHGVLFALRGADLVVTAVSANVAEAFGFRPDEILSMPLAHRFDEASVQRIQEVAPKALAGMPRPVRLRTADPNGAEWRAYVHASSERVIVEAKLPRSHQDFGVQDFLIDFDLATRSLKAAGDLNAITTTLAEEVRRLTGYDRVMIYRFAGNWDGEVIAEANSGVMPSYLGLHFPASDIPVQARALYALNPERQIPDVSYEAVPLVGDGAGAIDLSRSLLRSVSPIHVQYLRNMGVQASMSISILRQDALWGLIACHHHVPRYLSPELRQAAVLLAQLAAWQLGLVEESNIVRRSVDVKAVEALLLKETTSGRDYRDALLRTGSAFLELMQATGFVLSHGSSVTTIGRTPQDDALEDLLGWLASRNGTLFETDHLSAHFTGQADPAVAAGIIAISLGGSPRNLMIWFRPEIAGTVTWGGDPSKPVEAGGGNDRLTPRKSFAAWTEQVHGHSRSWAVHEIAAANSLRDMIVDIILRRSEELEQLNAELVRTNEELEAFAYVASHDLREPLRQIETFGTLLERAFRNRAAPGNVTRWFDGIQASSRRLRTLINDLAEFSRLGRHANPFTPVSLHELLANVTTDLGRLIEETGASVQADGTLPVLVCDPVQMQQVLQNVVGNGLKYRHPDRSPVIRLTAKIVRDQDGAASAAGNALRLSVSDNGIGIDERYWEKIFEPFQRLHSSDQYEGSGIGLAICRKIVERHRGSISVSSVPGQGSTFTIAIPLRAPVGVPDQP